MAQKNRKHTEKAVVLNKYNQGQMHYLYIINSGVEIVKFGTTTRPDKRLKAHRLKWPNAWMLYKIPFDSGEEARGVERMLVRRFRHCAVPGHTEQITGIADAEVWRAFKFEWARWRFENPKVY